MSMRANAIIVILCVGSVGLSGCSTVGQMGTLLAAGGAGTAAGYLGSHGNPWWTAAGTAAGLGVGVLVNSSQNSAQQQKFQDGYDQGKCDAVKQHYWMLQRLQECSALDSEGVQHFYQVTLPAQTDESGVKRTSRNITIPIVE